MGEPVRVDEGRCCHVGAGEGDCAAGERRNEGDVQGCVVVAVERVGWLLDLVVAVEGGDGEIFEFGPVRGEVCQGGDGCVGEL